MDAKVGFWSAFGAILGGAAGAAGGRYAAQMRPRARTARGPLTADSVEDAMIIGAAGGAIVGAYIGGAASAPEVPPQLTSAVR